MVNEMGDNLNDVGKPCVIFDLDGTLMDTSQDLIAAANACFVQKGVGPLLDPIKDAGTAVRGGRAMLRLGFSRLGDVDEADVDEWYQPLLDAYAQDVSSRSTFYEGAMEAVEALKLSGYAVGICTNKPERLARQLLLEKGVLERFDSLIGADTLPVRKPDPAPLWEAVDRADGSRNTCLIVGDTLTDYKTAQACGMPSILVTFGPDGDITEELSPDGEISHFDQLLDEVSRVIG